MTDEEAYSELIKGYDLETLLDIASNIDRHKQPYRFALLVDEIKKRQQEMDGADRVAGQDGDLLPETNGEGYAGEGFDGESLSEDGRAPKPRPVMNAWRALLVFLLFLVVQIVGGFVIGFFAGIALTISGVDIQDPEVFKAYEQPLTSLITLGGLLVGIPVMLALSLRWSGGQLRDRSTTGIGCSLGKGRYLLTGFLAGAATSIVYLFLASLLTPVETEQSTLGPMTEMAATPGLSRWIWLIIALLLAPPVEEFLFRGVMLGGFTRSLGPAAAAVIVSVLFVASHVLEAIHYWPAFVGIGAMALLTLHFRWKSQALGPAVAVHFGYNLVLVSFVLL